MTKRDSTAPVWERVSKNARMGSDRKRGLYVAARRLAAPRRAAVRTVAARRGGGGAGFTIPTARGFVVHPPDHFPESREIVEVARQRFAEVDADRSDALRRTLGYEYRNRVTDEEAQAAMGDLDLTALEGEPGTTCLVDTSCCFHYGSRLEAQDEGRLVAMIQYLTPYSFMLPRDYRRAAPYRHLLTDSSGRLERLVLGAG